MSPHIWAAVILLAVSWIVVILGYRIGSRQQLWWIAGLEVSKVRDRTGLARWVGTGLMSIGVLDLLISLAVFAASDRFAVLVVAYVVVNVVGAVALLMGMRRYLK
jgi:hypothetical protein